MAKRSRSRHAVRLPGQRDFDPWGDLDANEAWKNFGGLSIEAASARFAENPLRYQEDFMFMGDRAFAFYFPVIESHLTAPFGTGNFDDREAWILAHGIMSHLQGDDFDAIRPLLPRIRNLAESILRNVVHFGGFEMEQNRIGSVWAEVKNRVDEIIGLSK